MIRPRSPVHAQRRQYEHQKRRSEQSNAESDIHSRHLKTPTGIAFDTANNPYIAESHNHRIRKVTSGIITTVDGTGIPVSQAITLSLHLPRFALAVDANTNLCIADTNNHRIRKLSGTTTTITGSGEELLREDDGPTVVASLDLPTGIAVDTACHLYIADRHNHRISMIDAAGVISTIAGTGPVTYAGSFWRGQRFHRSLFC